MKTLKTAVMIPAGILTATLLAVVVMLPLQANALLTQQLDIGETNSDVTELQTFLAANSSYYPEGIISGYFGSLTSAAVARFQTANGLAAVGRVGPQTLALINSLMGGGGGGNTGGDASAPIIYPETVTAGSNSVTISWTTSESSRGRVMYGNSWPFLYSTAPSVSTSGSGSTSSVTLTGLTSNTTYFYVLESVDGNGNVQWTTGKSVKTQ